MKVLITGGFGFIGSNFVNLLDSENHDVLIIDKMTYASCKSNVKNQNIKCLELDIFNKEDLDKAIQDFQPSAIVHFAAESHVDNSIENPSVFLNTNIIGTYNLLQSSLKLGKDFHFIHISTDEVFGDLGMEGYFNEGTSYDPKSPYSASKASSDHLVRAWANTYDFPASIVNCSNNYGPNQHLEKLIPKIITNCFQNKTIPVYGSGENIRDWIFVEDFCRAILLILQSRDKAIGETFCIGSNHELTNISLVKQICRLINSSYTLDHDCLELIQFVGDRLGHDFRYAIDSSKIQKVLGWQPKYSFESGIVKTIEHYKKSI
jgi:dTDP-glucose 4,6-dehydratase